MSRAIGTPTETAVVRFLQENGWPAAERRALHGSKDLGDVTGCPGLVFEVKGGAAAMHASDGQVDAWLAETEEERQNARADYGILVMKRKGVGFARAGWWTAVMKLGDLHRMLEPDALGATVTHVWHTPVRMRLYEMTNILRLHGYGDPR